MLVSAQAAVQSRLRPAIWSSYTAKMHSEEHSWMADGWTFEEIERAFVETVNELREDGLKFQVFSIDRKKMVIIINMLTHRFSWLDQFRFRFKKEPGSKRFSVKVFIYSTGILPLVVPLAPLFNVMFCLAPFFE